MGFYDADLIDEEVILEWGKKVSKKYVSKDLSEKIHEKVKPFLTWLKEAEEEESDERVHSSGIKEKKEEPIKNGKVEAKKEEVNANGNDEDEDDDLDIDDI